MALRWQHGSPSSAAQPALASDDAAELSSLPSGAEQPSIIQLSDDTPELTVGFYNVGIQTSQVGTRHWPKKEQALKQYIVKAFVLHDLHMLCLSELGGIHAGLAGKLQKTVTEWMIDLLADTAVAPVSVYVDAHYLTIVKQRDVVVAESRLISS